MRLRLPQKGSEPKLDDPSRAVIIDMTFLRFAEFASFQRCAFRRRLGKRARACYAGAFIT
jgi:hypothetical protein